MGFWGKQQYLANVDPCEVQMTQFYGIEIDDFAVNVAKTAMWISECQMLNELSTEIEGIKILPLIGNNNIRCADALTYDWTKLVKRNLSIKILDAQPIENALGGNVRQIFKLRKGLSQELAKKIVADIKDSKKKVQASIQGDQVRVSGKDKDVLQEIIHLLRANEEKYDYPLQFTNYR